MVNVWSQLSIAKKKMMNPISIIYGSNKYVSDPTQICPIQHKFVGSATGICFITQILICVGSDTYLSNPIVTRMESIIFFFAINSWLQPFTIQIFFVFTTKHIQIYIFFFVFHYKNTSKSSTFYKNKSCFIKKLFFFYI